MIVIALALLAFSGITAVIMVNMTNSLCDTRKQLYTYAADKFQKTVLISAANIWTKVSTELVMKPGMVCTSTLLDFNMGDTEISYTFNSTTLFLEMEPTPTLAIDIKQYPTASFLEAGDISEQGLMVIISEGIY